MTATLDEVTFPAPLRMVDTNVNEVLLDSLPTGTVIQNRDNTIPRYTYVKGADGRWSDRSGQTTVDSNGFGGEYRVIELPTVASRDDLRAAQVGSVIRWSGGNQARYIKDRPGRWRRENDGFIRDEGEIRLARDGYQFTWERRITEAPVAVPAPDRTVNYHCASRVEFAELPTGTRIIGHGPDEGGTGVKRIDLDWDWTGPGGHTSVIGNRTLSGMYDRMEVVVSGPETVQAAPRLITEELADRAALEHLPVGAVITNRDYPGRENHSFRKEADGRLHRVSNGEGFGLDSFRPPLYSVLTLPVADIHDCGEGTIVRALAGNLRPEPARNTRYRKEGDLWRDLGIADPGATRTELPILDDRVWCYEVHVPVSGAETDPVGVLVTSRQQMRDLPVGSVLHETANPGRLHTKTDGTNWRRESDGTVRRDMNLDLNGRYTVHSVPSTASAEHLPVGARVTRMQDLLDLPIGAVVGTQTAQEGTRNWMVKTDANTMTGGEGNASLLGGGGAGRNWANWESYYVRQLPRQWTVREAIRNQDDLRSLPIGATVHLDASDGEYLKVSATEFTRTGRIGSTIDNWSNFAGCWVASLPAAPVAGPAPAGEVNPPDVVEAMAQARRVIDELATHDRSYADARDLGYAELGMAPGTPPPVVGAIIPADQVTRQPDGTVMRETDGGTRWWVHVIRRQERRSTAYNGEAHAPTHNSTVLWAPPAAAPHPTRVYPNREAFITALRELADRYRTRFAWCAAVQNALDGAGLYNAASPPVLGDRVEVDRRQDVARMDQLPLGTILLGHGHQQRLVRRAHDWFNLGTGREEALGGSYTVEFIPAVVAPAF